MTGLPTLWGPGCDHAGITTQLVVEKMLCKKEKKTRHDLGRDQFTRLVWEWRKNTISGSTTRRCVWAAPWTAPERHLLWMISLIRVLGGRLLASDEKLIAATTEAFCHLYDEGYIYRSDRPVNWCTQLNTALSTLEIENKDTPGRILLSVPGYEKKGRVWSAYSLQVSDR